MLKRCIFWITTICWVFLIADGREIAKDGVIKSPVKSFPEIEATRSSTTIDNTSLQRIEERIIQMDNRIAELKGSVNDRLHEQEKELSNLQTTIKTQQFIIYILIGIMGLVVALILGIRIRRG